MIGGVEGFQPADFILQIPRQRVVGRAHMGEMRIAATGRQSARNQNGTHRRYLVIGMIGVPRPTDIRLLIRAFADHGDFGMRAFQREIIVDVDPAPSFGKGDVIVRRKGLIAKHRHAVFVNDVLHRD